MTSIYTNYAHEAYQRQVPVPKARHLLRLMVQRDPLLAWYGGQVAFVCSRLGAEAGLSALQKQDLLTAASLHDVGRLIERWRGPDAPDEHATLGEWLCVAAGLSPEVQRAVRHHHERADGAGGPDGLCGPEIPLLARIIAVADAYVDLASSSFCGVGPVHPDVRTKLLRLRGSLLDTDLVDLFLKRCSGPRR